MVDAYKALTEPPKPGVSMLANWLFDGESIAAGNDGDGRIDSGETVHLGVEMINRSGAADLVISIINARAPGARINDPFVHIDVPVADFGNIGPFGTADNGFMAHLKSFATQHRKKMPRMRDGRFAMLWSFLRVSVFSSSFVLA